MQDNWLILLFFATSMRILSCLYRIVGRMIYIWMPWTHTHTHTTHHPTYAVYMAVIVLGDSSPWVSNFYTAVTGDSLFFFF